MAAGKFGKSYALFKNRDRNYVPKVKIIHEVRDGVEVAYLKDDKTGWIEGINEHGIGVVNAALMVSRDETERDEVERTGKKLLDGDRILKALLERTVASAVKSVRTYQEGLKGHTIVSDGKKTVYVEMPDTSDEEHGEVPLDKVFVRTNHGIEFPDAGYVEGPREESSKSRQEEAEKVLKKVKSPEDVAPAILRARTDRWEPTEMVRDHKSPEKMRTTTQMVLDLTEKKLLLYLLPGKVKYLGLDDRLPKDFEPHIKIEVHEYEDLKAETDGDTEEVKKTKKTASQDLLPILDPAFNIREIFKQLVLLEDHLSQPRKRCLDCCWKHLLCAEALAEEGVTLDVNHEHSAILDGLAESIRGLQRQVQDGKAMGDVAQAARVLRKTLLGVASSVRVASKHIADGCSGTSYAWVSPKGETIPVGGLHHGAWAERYFRAYPDQLDWGADNDAGWISALLRLGWVRVTNSRAIEADGKSLVSQAAWDEVVSIVVNCAIKERLDPESDDMWITLAGRDIRMTIANFVQEYGDRAASDKLFKALRTDTLRYASRPLCDKGTISYGWVTPRGRVVELHGDQEHEDWAWEYMESHSAEKEQWAKWRAEEKYTTKLETLLRLGWIRVTAIDAIQAWDATTPSQVAWDAVVRLMVGCVAKGDIDPEDKRVYINYRQSGFDTQGMSPAEFVKEYGGKKAVDQMFEQLMAKKAHLVEPSAGQVIAWIAPDGKASQVHWGISHIAWASKYLRSHPIERAQWQRWQEEEGRDKVSSYHALLRLGWIRVAGLSAIQSWSDATPTQIAWDVAVQMVVDGVADPDLGLTPDSIVWVNEMVDQDRDVRMSLAEFVKKYGGKKAVDQMFEQLMAKRVASKHLQEEASWVVQGHRITESDLKAISPRIVEWGVEQANEAVEVLDALHFPLTVYRGIHLPVGEVYDARDPGNKKGGHWTWTRAVAEHFAKGTHEGSDTGTDGTPVLLSGVIPSSSGVDWATTVDLYLSFSSRGMSTRQTENEIVPLHVTRVQQDV